jgi:hypothetical protein
MHRHPFEFIVVLHSEVFGVPVTATKSNRCDDAVAICTYTYSNTERQSKPPVIPEDIQWAAFNRILVI